MLLKVVLSVKKRVCGDFRVISGVLRAVYQIEVLPGTVRKASAERA